MRFITEFELWSPFEIKNYKGLRERGSAEWLGVDIAKAFGWDKKDVVVPNNPTVERHSLEIQAFPMDKWIEFKKRLFNALPDYDVTSRIKIINAMAYLESHEKPVTNDQSKTGSQL